MKTTLNTALPMAIRLGAVLLAVSALENIALLVVRAQGDAQIVVGTLLFSLLYLGTAAVLWLWPGMLAWWASSRSSHDVLESPITAEALQRIALSVLGAWLAVSGLSGVLSHGLTMWFLHERMSESTSGLLPPVEWRWLVYYAVQMVAGSMLVAGATPLVALLARLRGGPLSANSVQADAEGSG